MPTTPGVPRAATHPYGRTAAAEQEGLSALPLGGCSLASKKGEAVKRLGVSRTNEETDLVERGAREPMDARLREGGTSGNEVMVSGCARVDTSFCG